MKEYRICFKYADQYSNWNWRSQQCSISAENEAEARLKCIRFYGLGKNCDYEIVSIEEVQ